MNKATLSNAISQRVMKPLNTDVFVAAKERASATFNDYDKVVVSYSCSKDSTCVMELALEDVRHLPSKGSQGFGHR